MLRPALMLLLLARPLLAADPPKVDRHGMPLPPGAIARLGDARLRHASPVTHLAFSADGARLLCLCEDQSVHVWDAKTGLPVAQLPVGSAQSAALPPDGKSLVVIDPNGHFKHFDLSDVRKPTRDDRIEGYTGGLAMLAPDGGSFAYLHGARDEEHFHIIRVADWKVTAEIASPRPGLTREAKFSGDGKRIAFVDGESERLESESAIRVHEAVGGKLVMAYASKEWAYARVSLDTTGRRVAASRSEVENGFSRRRRARAYVDVWDVASNKLLYSSGSDTISGMMPFTLLASDGKRVVYCGWNATRVSDVDSGKELRKYEIAHTYRVMATWSTDGKTLAVVESGCGVRLFDSGSGRDQTPAEPALPPEGTCCIHLDGRFVAWASGGKSREWDFTSGRDRGLVPTPVLDDYHRVLAHDNRRLVTRSSGSPPVLWDRQTNRRTAVVVPADARMFYNVGGQLVADGKHYLLQTDQPPGVLVYEADTGRFVRRVELPRGIYTAIHLPAGGRVAVIQPSQRNDGFVPELPVWDLDAPAKKRYTLPVRLHTGDRAYLMALTVTPDGRGLCLTLAEEQLPDNPDPRRVVRVFDLATGQPRASFRLTTHDEHAKLTPDGRTAIITRFDSRGDVAVWDVLSGERRRAITDSTRDGLTDQLLTTPDSRYLVVTSSTRLGHVWDLHTPIVDPNSIFTNRSAAWDALALREADKPHAAIAWLAARPAESMPFLAERVKAPEKPTAQQVAEWINQLNADAFRDREAAEAKLRGAVRDFAKTLEDAATTTTSPEVRTRLRKLLAAKDRWLPSPEERRMLRAIEVLERIGTPVARDVLKKLAAGPAEAWVTTDATAALERLAK